MTHLCTTAPWPIPAGWTYTFEDIHSIERDVGEWRLTIAEQEDDVRWAKWSWWAGPKGSGFGIVHGEADDMLGAIWCAFDSLARQIAAAPEPPRFDPARAIAEALTLAGVTRQKDQAEIIGETPSHWNRHLKGRSPSAEKVQVWLDRAYSRGYPITLTAIGSRRTSAP